jgi:hypothetical protein
MLLRSIIEHVKAQNWTAVVLDFVIVVVGILIAFQITEWNAARADRDREAEILEDMLADLELDRSEYALGIAFTLRRIGAANASLAGAGRPILSEFSYGAGLNTGLGKNGIITAPQTPTIPAERQDHLWGEITIMAWPTPSTSTFDAMVGAGDIEIIRDRELVREMQAYRFQVDEIIQLTRLINMPLRHTALETGTEYGLEPFGAFRADDFYRLVKEEPRLEAVIRWQAGFSIILYEQFKSKDAHAAALQERLRAAGAEP